MNGEVAVHLLGEAMRELSVAMERISVERRLSKLRHASKIIASVHREELESLSDSIKKTDAGSDGFEN